MKKLARWLLNALTMLSLLLCVATAGLWTRSYWRADGAEYQPAKGTWWAAWWADPQTYWLTSANGAIEVGWDPYLHTAKEGVSLSSSPFDAATSFTPQQHFDAVGGRRFFGFGYLRKVEHDSFFGISLGQTVRFWELLIPSWSLSLVTAVVPALWLYAYWRRRRRRAVGCCLACGYDLTGNVSGVCPECGTAMVKGNA